MKQTIRLNEQELKQLIREAIDMATFPSSGDAVARNNWWKTQVDNEFPNHGVKDSRDWQSEYYNQADMRDEKAKLAKKQERENQRLERQKAKDDAKKEKKRIKSLEKERFFDAVFYTFSGDDALLPHELAVSPEYDKGIVGNKWYDGITKLPLMVKSENGFEQVMGRIVGFGGEENEYTYGDYHEDGSYKFSEEYGVEFGEGEDDYVDISLLISVWYSNKYVQVRVMSCSNPNVRPNTQMIEKYVNGVVRRNYNKLKQHYGGIEKSWNGVGDDIPTYNWMDALQSEYGNGQGKLDEAITRALKKVINETFDFSSNEKQFDMNSDEYQKQYDALRNDAKAKDASRDNSIMDIQTKHFNGDKNGYPERGEYQNLGLKPSQRTPKKGPGYSIETIKSNVISALKRGVDPNEIPNFDPYNDEQLEYVNDWYAFPNYITPIGVVCGSFLVVYNEKLGEYQVDDEPMEM